MKGKFVLFALILVIALAMIVIQAGKFPVSAAAEQRAGTAMATSHLSLTGALDTTPAILMDSTTTDGFGGGTVTFTAGGVSGGVAWSAWQDAPGASVYTGGGAPAAGSVSVFGEGMTEIGEFALPLASDITFSGVDAVRVTVAVPLPTLPEGTPDMRSSYAVEAVASVHWIQQ
ncbi:MAG: hypothetical protein QCH35_01125 [Methanomicrobiaceae archaeon]|nr:hypothetical protein [Methanomicrobiaceae archaeon]